MRSSDAHMFPRVREVTRSLARKYGHPSLGNKRNPIDEILFIILSSKTPPDRYKKTYLALKKKCPCHDDLANIKPSTIARVIRIGGLAEKKGRQISEIAGALKQRFGRVTLNQLSRLSDEEAELLLDDLPGIGKKMARCVLMYSLDRPVFPVDAHCFRISQRLGWVSADDNLTDRLADVLQEGIPARLRRDLHVGMILLGREFCKPKDPSCTQCPLLNYCPTGRRRIKQRSIEKRSAIK
jgi:endonuclease III